MDTKHSGGNGNQADAGIPPATVDGDKLAEALRRVSPFMHESLPALKAVLMEVYPDRTEFTACDGFRLAHLTIREVVGQEGEFLLEGNGVKDFSQRHYNGSQVPVVFQKADESSDQVTLGEVTIPILQADYPDYKDLIPTDLDNIAIITTKDWIKALRSIKAWTVGVLFSQEGCSLYFVDMEKNAGKVDLPVQMYAGQEKRIVFKPESLRKALSSCGAQVTIKVPTAAKTNGPSPRNQAVVLETDNYWMLIIPQDEQFPREVNLNLGERELVKWGIEALGSVLTGDVQGKVLVGGGKFYLEIGVHITKSEVTMEAPMLQEAKEVTIAK